MGNKTIKDILTKKHAVEIALTEALADIAQKHGAIVEVALVRDGEIDNMESDEGEKIGYRVELRMWL